MFESNFPPDKGQCSYQVIFNAFKRIAAQYSEAEKTALFSGTAARVLRAEDFDDGAAEVKLFYKTNRKNRVQPICVCIRKI